MPTDSSDPLPGERSLGDVLERVIRAFELLAAVFLVGLFGVGVLDLGLRIADLAASGRITEPRAVVGLVDTALLLFIVVEVFLTVIAYSRDEPVVRIVVVAGLIAITRKIITYRTAEYPSVEAALLAAAAYGGLLAVLVGAFYVIREQEPSDAGDETLV